MGNLKRVLFYILTIPILSLLLLPNFIFKNFGKMNVDELVFVLLGNNTGANYDIVWKFVLEVITIWLVLFFVIRLLRVLLKYYINKNDHHELIDKFNSKKKRYVTIFSIVLLVALTISYETNFSISSYISSRRNASLIYEENYIDPRDVEIEFPSKKKNLIYILLESVSNGMTSVNMPGHSEPINLIENLDLLRNSGHSFSGFDGTGTGHLVHGATSTVAALVGKTGGVPLTGPLLTTNSYGSNNVFLPGLMTIGEILHQNGYSNYLSIGSDSNFAGKNVYFSSHGNYTIYDLNYWYESKKVPEGYNVFWGIEDSKLFDYSKEKLLEISKNDEPFSFTMLTVDTHFSQGYIDETCPVLYEVQYANAFNCSDKLVTEFVEWIMEQDFYENTTVVLAADHPTMNRTFLEDHKIEDTSLYNLFLNVDFDVSQDALKNRVSTVSDLFPTTLRSLNVKIPGDRLGLGTDLFSGKPTLPEVIGLEEYDTELRKKSNYYEANFFRRKN